MLSSRQCCCPTTEGHSAELPQYSSGSSAPDLGGQDRLPGSGRWQRTAPCLHTRTPPASRPQRSDRAGCRTSLIASAQSHRRTGAPLYRTPLGTGIRVGRLRKDATSGFNVLPFVTSRARYWNARPMFMPWVSAVHNWGWPSRPQLWFCLQSKVQIPFPYVRVTLCM